MQRSRARQYAVCTFALAADRSSDGAEAIFDQAATNGLAAIVAYAWPGAEVDKRSRVLSAAALLEVITARGTAQDDGVVLIEHAPALSAREDDLIGAEPVPNATRVDVRALRAAITATQAVRHARQSNERTDAALADKHVEALRQLDFHPALFSLTDESIDRAELEVARTDAVEHERAGRFFRALDDEDREARGAVDYVARYAWETHDDRVEVEGCPVCENASLVARRRETLIDEIGIGHCLICSYERTRRVAEDIAMAIDLQRLIDRND